MAPPRPSPSPRLRLETTSRPAARAPRATAPLELAKDAPDRYVVVKGDTLWDISGKFLQKPWRWPEIWQLNRDQIRNPHWIYPGNIVYLDMSSGQPRLRLGQPVGDGGDGTANGTLKMQPTVRADSLRENAITTISSSVIAAFVNRPLIVTEFQLKTNPRVLAAQDGRVYLGRGDLAYVRGIKDDTVTEWHIYRQAKPILDPDTRKPIAFEALFVGSARLERTGDPATVRITGTSEEVGVGDRLMPAELGKPFNYAPQPARSRRQRAHRFHLPWRVASRPQQRRGRQSRLQGRPGSGQRAGHKTAWPRHRRSRNQGKSKTSG